MVGEQGNRTSGTRTASVPQSYWWRKLHSLNARSRLQEVSGSLSCTEKFSSLVSCHRGYGSVAFYAVFSLFILTFLYAIWKIVSAHSRSARRPGSGNTTSVAKLSPTAHAPSSYFNTHAWLQKEHVLDHFHQSLKKLPPFQNEAPQEKPSPAIFLPPETDERSKISSIISNTDFPSRGQTMPRNPSPTWTWRGIATKPFYNYQQGGYNTVQPSLNNPLYPTVPYPSGLNPLFPMVPYPPGFQPYLRSPFFRGANNNQRFQFRMPTSRPVPYNNNYNRSNRKADISYRSPYYYFPTNKNSQVYYGDNTLQSTEGGIQSSPSPLISFLNESYNDTSRSKNLSEKSRRKRKKLGRKPRGKEKKKSNHMRHHVKYDNVEDIEEKSKKNLNKEITTKHHRVKNYQKAKENLRKKNHEKISKGHKYFMEPKNNHPTQHAPPYKQTRGGSAARVNEHARYRGKKSHLKLLPKSRRAKSPKYRRTSIPHVKKITRASHLKKRRHETPKAHHHVHHTPHHRHNSVLDFRLYRLYRKHHSVNDEIRGKWNISRHRVRTCKLIDRFSTRGTVKTTRTMAGKNRYLHTLLICRPVRLRIRKRIHRRRYSLKYAQLCRKKWFVSEGLIRVQKTSNDQEIPRYTVQICEPSYVHGIQRLSVNSKETKIWKISDEFVRKMEREDEKNVHIKGQNKKKKVKKQTKLKQERRTRSRQQKQISYHVLKTKKHSIFSVQKSKPKTNNQLHEKQSHQSRKSQAKRKKHHDRKENKVLKNKNKTISKPKGGDIDSEKGFYGKLLKVLKLAKIYDRKKGNRTPGDGVFDSLEAVLAQSQNITKESTRSKPTVKPSVKKHSSHQSSRKHTWNNQDKSNDNVQRLLAKILPAVLKSFHSDDLKVGDSADSKVTTRPTPKTTTKPRTKTAKATPTSQMPPSTTKSSKNNIEKIMKNILPLLLKGAQRGNSDSLQAVKVKSKAKPPPSPPIQRSFAPKKTTEKPGLKSLLSSLGMDNLVSDSLSSTIMAKMTAVTNKSAIKPTQRALLKSNLLAKTPLQLQIRRAKPTYAVTTIQAPPLLRQADALRDSGSLPASQASARMAVPPVPLSASPATTVFLPAPPVPPSPEPPPISALQTGIRAPPGNGKSVSAYSPPINSDRYSRSILCFGDSLTSGYYNHGHSFHPYSQRLAQLLNSGEGRLRYYVKTSGKVREMAHGSMARRLPQVLGNSSRFDWVIILGGTNDVAHVKNFGDDDSFMNQLISVWKPRIVRDIEVLHEIAHKFGARSMLLTIPETAYEAWPNFKTLWVMRKKLNQDLRDYARRSQGSTVLCDLAARLPRHSLSPQAQAALWNDHLHLTPYGYDKMAEIVYQCLKPYLTLFKSAAKDTF